MIKIQHVISMAFILICSSATAGTITFMNATRNYDKMEAFIGAAKVGHVTMAKDMTAGSTAGPFDISKQFPSVKEYLVGFSEKSQPGSLAWCPNEDGEMMGFFDPNKNYTVKVTNNNTPKKITCELIGF